MPAAREGNCCSGMDRIDRIGALRPHFDEDSSFRDRFASFARVEMPLLDPLPLRPCAAVWFKDRKMQAWIKVQRAWKL